MPSLSTRRWLTFCPHNSGDCNVSALGSYSAGGVSAAALQRFWGMLAHFHGQVWNAAELARSMGVNESMVRRYLDLLEGVFMVRRLQPWHANLKKRLQPSRQSRRFLPARRPSFALYIEMPGGASVVFIQEPPPAALAASHSGLRLLPRRRCICRCAR